MKRGGMVLGETEELDVLPQQLKTSFKILFRRKEEEKREEEGNLKGCY